MISGGLILGFRNVIGDLPMSNGQTLAQMYPSLQTIYDFLWLIGERDLLLPAGRDLLVSGEKNGRHADPWYRAWRDTGFPPADERLSARAAAAEVWDFGMFSIAKSGLSGAGDPGTVSRAGAGRY
ncbi:trehalose-specific PTS system EIIBC component [Escherichia coli]|uniref:Trehalose-specific PTS system EIIBC component n=1 Tax=Escherichia coli TaxID=562 RepID=A0A376L1Z7_ECOLX|nr:trehalose-specific PTS system EIIBC component [Escherichia coli]